MNHTKEAKLYNFYEGFRSQPRSSVLGVRVPVEGSGPSVEGFIWEFPNIRGTLFRGPYNKDPTS